MKVLVAGAGAIGCWLGARLSTDHDVTLLGRPALASAVADGGLRITGLTTFDAPIPVVTEAAGRFDAIILTSKAHATAQLAPEMAKHVAPGGFLMSLQNGLGNREKMQAFAPDCNHVVALTSHGVSVERPGVLVHAGEGATRVAPAGPTDQKAAHAGLDLLTDAGLAPEWVDDARPYIWQKAVVNAGINPVAALHDVPNGELLDERWSLVGGLVRESVALAKKARVELPPGDLVDITRDVCQKTAKNWCSMAQDTRAKRPTEIEQITGRMVRLGELLLVSMPKSDFVYGRMKDLERSYLGAQADEMAWHELQAPGDV